MLLLVAAPASAQGIIFVARHAERADAGTTPKPGADPSLSETGRQRAASLALILKDAGITAIFATEYKRTQETAAPLAKALGVELTVVPSNDIDGLVGRLTRIAGNALVVGHSNSVPDVIRALGVSTAPPIGDDEFDSLFVVAVGADSRMVRLRYR